MAAKKKRQLNPITLIRTAIFFFFIDYLAFQKPISIFIAWLLIVIPLLLLAVAFFLWGLRGQFPWASFPSDPMFMSGIIPKSNNTFHAFIVCLVFLFLAIMATIVFFNK